MTTHRDSEIDIWVETCIEFIGRADSIARLEAVGEEIKTSRAIIKASHIAIQPITDAYLAKRNELRARNEQS